MFGKCTPGSIDLVALDMIPSIECLPVIDAFIFSQSLALHIDDSVYTTAVLTIVSELVRHCDCCCQGLSQVELADAFFYADLGKILLEILNRY